ncbi:hypothetical protein [Fodinicola acaciae]|uniref:hypothetical protein n=1 Tax=Fodinicola acaciae TaxID=2681555 RepID=UPI0013D5E246|nr:hypothetical protein [Fodinicola acaciae]
MEEPTDYGRRADDWTEAVLESIQPNGAESVLEVWKVADQMAADLWQTVVLGGMALDVEDIVPCASKGVPVVRVVLAPCKVRRLMDLARRAGFRAQEAQSGPPSEPPDPDGNRHAA